MRHVTLDQIRLEAGVRGDNTAAVLVIPRNIRRTAGVVIREGELEAFHDNLLACGDSLYRYARSLARDPAAAEELVQETYRRALDAKQRPAPMTQEAMRPWLFTILRHLWQNELRWRNRTHRVLQEVTHDPESAAKQAQRALLQWEVRQAIDSLPEQYREVLVLRDIEGLSYAEIGSVLRCPAGTVMSRLSRARESLRQSLWTESPSSREVGR
jgi:RNA polymerase sigma-70 factor, ECF subfamily